MRPPHRPGSGRHSRTTPRPAPPYRPRKACWGRGKVHPPHRAASCGRAPTGSAARRYNNSTTSRRASRAPPPWDSSTARSAGRGSPRGRESARGSPPSRCSRPRPMRPWPPNGRPRASGRGRPPPRRNSCPSPSPVRSRDRADALSVSCSYFRNLRQPWPPARGPF